MAVLGAIGGVDLVIEVGIGVHEGDVFLDDASLDVSFVARLCATELGGSASVNGSDIEIVVKADDPNRHRVSQRAVTPE